MKQFLCSSCGLPALQSGWQKCRVYLQYLRTPIGGKRRTQLCFYHTMTLSLAQLFTLTAVPASLHELEGVFYATTSLGEGAAPISCVATAEMDTTPRERGSRTTPNARAAAENPRTRLLAPRAGQILACGALVAKNCTGPPLVLHARPRVLKHCLARPLHSGAPEVQCLLQYLMLRYRLITGLIM